jgi:hypothetical protein
VPRMIRPPGGPPPPNPEPYKDPGKAVCGLCKVPKTSLHTSRGFIRACLVCDGVGRWPNR